jgi:transketolase
MTGAYLYDTRIHARKKKSGPVVILGSRQNLPQLAGTNEISTLKGAYVIHEAGKDKKTNPDVTLIATGSEVSLAVNGADLISSEGLYVRVVSAPCLQLFDEQPVEYRA